MQCLFKVIRVIRTYSILHITLVCLNINKLAEKCVDCGFSIGKKQSWETNFLTFALKTTKVQDFL